MGEAELLDKLRALGVDVDGALGRCMNNKDLYFHLLKMFLDDVSMSKLRTALDVNDLREAFLAAHALKGVAGNLGFSPAYKAAVDIVEPLRHEQTADYESLYAALDAELEPIYDLIREAL